MRKGPILVVDDDLDLRETLADTLKDRGFDVVTAANGLEALKLVRSLASPPSVILLDLMMPVMDGYGFLEERRKDPGLASIPLAIVTAGHGVDRKRLGNGAPIVPKPFNLPQLLGILHQLRSEAEDPA
ncbi:MAG TPA: response regulator [Gemmatimonadales bacterium]|nr:response regulator [Gemmatimonadales bacterium]